MSIARHLEALSTPCRAYSVSVACFLVLMIAGAGASAPAETLVATPGRGFGPLTIGERAPQDWDVVCILRSDKEYLYARLGLVAEAPLDNPEGRISRISAKASAPALVGTCVTPTGESASRDVEYPPPASITYVSSGGIGFGSTSTRLEAAHGRPDSIFLLGDGLRYFYCGISFQVHRSDRVTEISVDAPRGRNCRP